MPGSAIRVRPRNRVQRVGAPVLRRPSVKSRLGPAHRVSHEAGPRRPVPEVAGTTGEPHAAASPGVHRSALHRMRAGRLDRAPQLTHRAAAPVVPTTAPIPHGPRAAAVPLDDGARWTRQPHPRATAALPMTDPRGMASTTAPPTADVRGMASTTPPLTADVGGTASTTAPAGVRGVATTTGHLGADVRGTASTTGALTADVRTMAPAPTAGTAGVE